MNWSVKYDTGDTYPHADIILTPDIVSQLKLVQGCRLEAFEPLPSGAMFQYDSVKVASPVDPALNVELLAGAICNDNGEMMERDIPIISLWGMAKLNCKIHPSGTPESSQVQLVKACDYDLRHIP